MMKKRYFVVGGLVLATCLGGVLLFARTSNDTNQDGLKPIRTIEKFVGKDVTEGEFEITADVEYYILPDKKGNYDYSYCAVENLSRQNIQVLFLYNEDSSVIEATDQKRSFINKDMIVDTSYMEDQYHNEKNFADDSFAYRNGTEVAAFLSEEAGYRCSSIWAINSSNEVVQIWKDEENSNS